jgi:uncharacterized membrane protein YbhN (UPF0104 family)/tRNA A-37 threonylcarbamoyl transferase component Bud32
LRKPRRAFGAADEHPYRRLTADWIKVGLAAVLITASLRHVGNATATEKQIESFFSSLPSGLDRVFNGMLGLGVLWGVGLVVVASLVARRWRLALVLASAGALTWFFARFVGFIASGRDVGHAFTSVFSDAQSGSYPAVHVAVIASVILAAAPFLTRPMRRLNQFLLVAVLIGALVVGVGGVNDVFGAFAIAWGVAALLHLAFGSPAGRPTTAQVVASLEDLGLAVQRAELTPEQSRGFTRMTATTDDGEVLPVKVYGRDAADTQLVAKAWRFFAYKDSGPTLTITRLQQVEHEALCLYAARESGVCVPEVVAAGVAGPSAAILVTRAPASSPLDSDDPRLDQRLRGLWHGVGRLRNMRLAHGALDLDHVAAEGDGTLVTDFANGSVSAPAERLDRDVAQLLVATASLAGEERATRAAIDGIGQEVVAAALPYLQKPALTRANRNLVRHDKKLLERLRTEVTDKTGVDAPETIELRRVKPLTILMFVAFGFALWVVLGQVGSISELIDTLKTAEVPWLIAGFVFAQSTAVAFALVTIGSVPDPIPLIPATILQMAISFTNMVAPSGAASAVMNIRFLQKQGVEIGAATSSGVLAGLSGTMAQFGLFVVSAIIVGQSASLNDVGKPGDGDSKLILLIVVLAAIAIGVVLVVPRLRRFTFEKVWPQVKGGVRNIWGILTNPRQLTYVLGGSITSQLLYALCLGCCLHAYGGSLSYINLVFVNTSASFLASLTPVPGGMGVQEASLIAGLTAFGVPPEIASAAVITHRLFTTYLPPIWGSYATKWLVADGYL